MDDITIRFADPADGAALACMIDSMDLYYRDPARPATETRSAVEGWLRSAANGTRFVLVFHREVPVGFAAFAVLLPGNALRGLLFLKDLFIAADWRGRGVGEQLMRFLAGFCQDQGIGRIDWVVETVEAQRFYERFGAETFPQKKFMRLDGDALTELAARRGRK